MSDIISKWLRKQLQGLPPEFDWHEDRNGILLSALLHSYGLLNKETYRNIQEETKLDEALQKLRQSLSEKLGIEYTKNEFQLVLMGKADYIAEIYYRLFLSLHDKTWIDFDEDHKDLCYGYKISIADKKLEEDLETISDSPETLEAISEIQKSNFDVLLQKHKTKLKQLKKKQEKDIPKPKFQQEALILPNEVGKLHEKEDLVHLTALKDFQNHCVATQKRAELQKQFKKELLRIMWLSRLEQNDNFFKNDFAKELDKQGIYEREQVAQFLNIREEKYLKEQNMQAMIEELENSKEKRLLERLQSDDFRLRVDRSEYYKARREKLALHRELYQKRLEEGQKKNWFNCQNIPEEFAGFAYALAELSENEIVDSNQMEITNFFDNIGSNSKLFISKLEGLEGKIENAGLEVKSKSILITAESLKANDSKMRNSIDDLTYDDYQNFHSKWKMDSECETSMGLGINILGFAVHKIMSQKFPLHPLLYGPSPSKPPVAAAFVGLENHNFLNALTALLESRNIQIIEFNKALDFCIGVYKKECLREYPEPREEKGKTMDKKSEKGKGNDEKSGKSGKTSESKAKSKSSKSKSPKVSLDKSVVTFEEKKVQTPLIFPSEDIELSPVGEIGLELTEQTIENPYVYGMALFEYIKSKNCESGWVLVNYPQTIAQATALEEILTGMPVPKVSQEKNTSYSSTYSLLDKTSSSDGTASIMKYCSNLVPNPKPQVVPAFESFLTAYIEMKKFEGDAPKTPYDCFHDTDDNPSKIHQFYESQGCHYTLYYNSLDFETVKRLGKLILGDYTIPPKDSQTLFVSQSVLDRVEKNFAEMIKPPASAKSSKKESQGKGKPKNDPKKNSSKKSTKESLKSGKQTKPTADTSEGPEQEDEETQIPELPPKPFEPYRDSIAPKPGEENWSYIDVDFDPSMVEALSNLWGNLERVYANDLKCQLYSLRIILQLVTPYNEYLMKKLMSMIHCVEDKNLYLQIFQKNFYEIDLEALKNEQCREKLLDQFKYLREQLWTTCDNRMIHNESERLFLAEENLCSSILLEVLNDYLKLVGIEMHRFVDTQMFLLNYYSIMVLGTSSQNFINKIELEILTEPSNEEEMDFLCPFKEYVTNLFKNKQMWDFLKLSNEVPFVHKMNQILLKCKEKISEALDLQEELFRDIQKVCNPIKNRTATFPPECAIKIYEPTKEVRTRSDDVLEEFKTAYMGETCRIKIRLCLLERAFLEDFTQTLRAFKETFWNMYKIIDDNYCKDINDVKEASDNFLCIIEHEPLENRKLGLQSTDFSAENNIFFTVNQLNNLVDIFGKVSPNGVISSKTFALILQDLAHGSSKTCLPKIWTKIKSEDFFDFTKTLFDNSEYLDWRDFILYNLFQKYPTENEIITMREEYRSWDVDHLKYVEIMIFGCVPLWTDFSWNSAIPNLLQKMFTANSNFQYITFLLALCKDPCPYVAFKKMLCLCLGSPICKTFDSVASPKDFSKFDSFTFTFCSRSTVISENEKIDEGKYEETKEDSKLNSPSKTSKTSATIEEIPNSNESKKEEIASIIIKDQSLPSQKSQFTSSYQTDQVHEDNSIFMGSAKEEEHKIEDYCEMRVPFDLLISLLRALIPWSEGSSDFNKVAVIYNSLLNDQNYVASLYQLIENEDFQELLCSTYRLYAKNAVDVVQNYVKN